MPNNKKKKKSSKEKQPESQAPPTKLKVIPKGLQGEGEPANSKYWIPAYKLWAAVKQIGPNDTTFIGNLGYKKLGMLSAYSILRINSQHSNHQIFLNGTKSMSFKLKKSETLMKCLIIHIGSPPFPHAMLITWIQMVTPSASWQAGKRNASSHPLYSWPAMFLKQNLTLCSLKTLQLVAWACLQGAISSMASSFLPNIHYLCVPPIPVGMESMAKNGLTSICMMILPKSYILNGNSSWSLQSATWIQEAGGHI